jgi:hypothetical protein
MAEPELPYQNTHWAQIGGITEQPKNRKNTSISTV